MTRPDLPALIEEILLDWSGPKDSEEQLSENELCVLIAMFDELSATPDETKAFIRPFGIERVDDLHPSNYKALYAALASKIETRKKAARKELAFMISGKPGRPLGTRNRKHTHVDPDKADFVIAGLRAHGIRRGEAEAAVAKQFGFPTVGSLRRAIERHAIFKRKITSEWVVSTFRRRQKY